MKFINVLISILVISSFASSVYYPLSGEDAKDGCLDYASESHRIVGNPDTTDGSTHPNPVYIYDFDFYIPQIEANMDDLRIEFQKQYGIQTYGRKFAMLAKINEVRVLIDFGDYDQSNGYSAFLYSDQSFLTGINSFYMTNTSDTFSGHVGYCPSKYVSQPGFCLFRVCGFYPELEIQSSTPPSTIDYDKDFNLSITITNNDDVDAGTVTINISDTDFKIKPSETTQTILAKNDTPFNELNYTLNFDPKSYVELDTGSTSIQKRIGKVVASFTDVNGKERKFEKNLGTITVLKQTASQNISSSANQNSSSKTSTNQTGSTNSENTNFCLPGFIILLPFLFLKRFY